MSNHSGKGNRTDKENQGENLTEKVNLEDLLKKLRSKEIDLDAAKQRLEAFFFQDRFVYGHHLTYDTQRSRLTGLDEVVYGHGKSAKQIAQILTALDQRGQKQLLITKITAPKWQETVNIVKSTAPNFANSNSANPNSAKTAKILGESPATTTPNPSTNARALPKKSPTPGRVLAEQELVATNGGRTGDAGDKANSAHAKKKTSKEDALSDSVFVETLGLNSLTLYFHPEAELATSTAPLHPKQETSTAPVAVVSGGTSDEKIALEATLSLTYFGISSVVYNDLGVASLARILKHREEIASHPLVIAIAGMEASLPTVLSGLVDCPIIAVPTSIGHGAHFHGLSALLSLLSSCSPGMSVVNIDSGFSAAACAAKILAKLQPASRN